MNRAFGIVNPAGNHIFIDGMQSYRTLGAFSFLGRYRLVDFAISNFSNSGIDRIQVYARKNPRSLVEHLGTGRHYNINSKSGQLRVVFADSSSDNQIYNTDIAAFYENLECIEKMSNPYVVIAPNYMVFTQNYSVLLDRHINSGADITLLYHTVDNAKTHHLNCDVLNLNRQKGVLSIEKNRGLEDERDVFMDTYIMKKELFIELIHKAREISSMYTLAQIVNAMADDLDIRGASHSGYFATIADFKSYFDANQELIHYPTACKLFDKEWPIYTRTNDSCPTKYSDGAHVVNSVVSNGCIIEGSAEHSVLGRGCVIGKDAVVKNCVLLPRTVIGPGVHLENQVVDKGAKVLHSAEVIAPIEKPGYIRRNDVI